MTPEKRQYKKDVLRLKQPDFLHLRDKMQSGASVSAFGMRQLRNRDFEMNGALYKEAKEETERLKDKNKSKCPACGGYKKPWYRVCYNCNHKTS